MSTRDTNEPCVLKIFLSGTIFTSTECGKTHHATLRVIGHDCGEQRYGLDSCGSAQGPVACSCEQDNELSGFVRYWGTLEQLDDCGCLNSNSVLWLMGQQLVGVRNAGRLDGQGIWVQILIGAERL
jgi:hypothetical protein